MFTSGPVYTNLFLYFCEFTQLLLLSWILILEFIPTHSQLQSKWCFLCNSYGSKPQERELWWRRRDEDGLSSSWSSAPCSAMSLLISSCVHVSLQSILMSLRLRPFRLMPLWTEREVRELFTVHIWLSNSPLFCVFLSCLCLLFFSMPSPPHSMFYQQIFGFIIT